MVQKSSENCKKEVQKLHGDPLVFQPMLLVIFISALSDGTMFR